MPYADINVFPVLGVLDESTYATMENQLLDELKRCSPDIGIDWINVRYSKQRLRRIVDMVEKRRIYFHVFHNGMEMGELNTADKRVPKRKVNFSKEIMDHLLHAFIFRDLSKEAIMALAESLIVAPE